MCFNGLLYRIGFYTPVGRYLTAPLPRQAAIVQTRLAFELPHIAGKDSKGSKLSEANQGDGGNPPTLS